MKKLHTNKPDFSKKTFAGLCLLIPTLIFASVSHAQDTVELQSLAEKEIVVLNESGKKVRKLVPAVTVVPGEEVVYTTRFTNAGTQPAENIVITNPVPEHTRYSADTATGDATEVTFSVDGGGHYAKPEQLTVTGEDGKEHTAKASDYTHIRWVYAAALATGKQSSVQYRAVLQ